MRPIRTDGTNAFARFSMQVRVPGILDDAIRVQPPGTPWTADAIRALAEEVVADEKIRELAAPAPDLDEWHAPVAARIATGDTWLRTDWFFAETYLYRRVVEAVRFYETNVDPYRATKETELASRAPWDHATAALAIATSTATSRETAMHSLLALALWGNRIDLSYAAAASHGTTAADDDLLVDDRARALPLLLAKDARIHVVLDNAGTELLVDLVLACAALDAGASVVVLHAKAHPIFVSDTIVADVHDALARFRARGGAFAATATRLDDAFARGRLLLAPDTYWNGPRFLDDAPPRIRRALGSATIAIVKGDANYRRIIGDAEWPPSTLPRDACGDAPLPCPLFALRTTKSDAIVGLPDGMSSKLDAIDPQWRSNGKRGLAQLF